MGSIVEPLRIESWYPTNLAKAGVKRRGDGIEADLETIWECVSQPVITNYMILCDGTHLTAFGGGNLHKQGQKIPGYINSGYRDVIIKNNPLSMHLFALAADPIVGGVQSQIAVGRKALPLFTRIGVYPDMGIMHLDLAPENWIRHFNKRHYWVIYRNGYQVSFDDWLELENYFQGRTGF